jgi:hypothetical protein
MEKEINQGIVSDLSVRHHEHMQEDPLGSAVAPELGHIRAA